jgi:glycosyltransferase involved in cell wall biosynthesis
MMPKVVRIIARLNVGGPALHVINLTRRLDGYESVLVAGSIADGEAEVDLATNPPLPLIRVPELGRAIRFGSDFVAFFKLLRILRGQRPHIVHTHTAKAGTLGRIAAWLAGVPVRVHTYHGHVFHGYFGRFLSAATIGIERMLALVTTRIVVISERQRREIVETYRIAPAHKVKVIPLGLELGRFASDVSAQERAAFRRDIGADQGQPIVTIVGRLVPIKNHGLFLEAAARVLKYRADVLFLIVGGGEMEAVLRQRARDLGIDGRVRFAGWRNDLPAIYAASSVVALSSNNEGTPVALIEALAAGVNVVATDVGGVADVLEDGRLGALVPAGDASAFADAIIRQLDNDQRPPAARMVARFSVERLAADIQQLYTQLLNEAPQRFALAQEPVES